MQSLIVAFISGGTFSGLMIWIAVKMFNKAGGPEMCETKCKRIVDLEIVAYNLNTENNKIEKKLSIAMQERNIAINHSKETLRDRNKKFKEIISKVTR